MTKSEFHPPGKLHPVIGLSRIREFRFVTAFLCCFIGMAVCAQIASGATASKPPNAIILDSYHQGYSWSDNEIAGFLERMREVYPLFDPPIEHIDSKRHPSEANLASFKTRLQEKYKGHKVDLIVAFDNPALEFLKKYKKELFPETPVVFGGVNDFHRSMLEGIPETTGVAEIMDDEKTLEMALKIHPNTKEALVIHDYTDSGVAVRKGFEKLLPKFSGRVQFRFLPPTTIDEAVQAIGSLPPDSLVLILTYTTDRSGRSLSLAESTRMLTESSRVPIYSMHETRLGYGIVGGQLLGGAGHGRRVADVALRVISSEKPESIPVDMSGGSIPMFDHSQLERFGIREDALPFGSVIVNKPESLWDRYRTLTIGVTTVVTVLSILVISLAISLFRLRKSQQEVRKSEAQYRCFVETANEGVWAMDGNFHTTFVNQRMAEMLGYSIEEMLGKPVGFFICEEDLSDHRHNMELRQQGRSQSYERRFRRKDGSTLWSTVSATALSDPSGKFSGSFAMFTDITQSKRAQEALGKSEAFFKAVFDQAAVGVAQIDSFTGRFITINQRYCGIVGYTREEMEQLTFQKITHPEDLNADLAQMKLLLDGQIREFSMEKRYFHKDGHVIWVNLTVSPMWRVGEPPSSHIAVVEDITERKLVEMQRSEIQQRLEIALEGGIIGIWDWYIDTGELYQDKHWLSQLGYSEGEVENRIDSWSDRIHPEDRPKVLEMLDGYLRGDLPCYATEHRLLTKSGQWKWIFTGGKVLKYDDAGKPVRMLGTHLDIHDRKLSEEMLRQSEMRYRTVAEFTYDWEYWVDPDGNFLYCSPSCERITGYSAQEFLNDPDLLNRIVHPDDRAHMIDHYHSWRKVRPDASGATDFRIIRRDGEIRWIGHVCQPVRNENGEFAGRRGGNRDITERHEAQAALRRSEDFLVQIVENIPNMLFVKDASELRFVRFNRAGEELLGLPRDELLGKNDYDFFPKEQADFFVSKDRAVLNDGKLLEIPEEEIVTRNKGKRILRTKKIPISDAQGSAKFLLGISEDITDLKRLEEKNLRFAAIADSTDDAIVGETLDGIITSWNRGAERIYGYGEYEILGKSIMILVPDDHQDEQQRFIEQVRNGKQLQNVETVHRKNNGETLPVSLTISSIIDDHGEIVGYSTIARDISDRVKAAEQRDILHEQLFHAQKMEAVGTLAGGIAHDFNNVLQIVMGFSELALMDQASSELHKDHLRKIEEAAKRGADLVGRLMIFSRKTEFKLQPLDLNHQITSLRKMLDHTLPKNIDIELVLEGKLSETNADSTGVDQILMNLAVNARDAMPQGGKLTFKTANVILDEDYAKRHIEVKPGPHVLLMVSDTGNGMDTATLNRIFEPFFTTKGIGEGTGLGLAVIHGIVKQHQGHIVCESEPGKGTTFYIYFPVLKLEKSLESKPDVEPQSPGGTETILIADDEQMVRYFLGNMLTEAGYRVIEASEGKEALEIYQSRHNEIDLVILDLMMPLMGGRECLKGLLGIDPSVKVVIASGYTTDGSIHQALDAGARASIQKPAAVREVLKVVREVLDAG